MKTKNPKLLSVIIPAYKQSRTIVSSIRSINTLLQSIEYDYEIIVVVDGDIDQTLQKAKTVASKKIKVVGYKTNKGKGYALRYGMARSRGDIVAFIDAGADLEPAGLRMLLAHFEWYKADIVVGSKWHPVSIVEYPLWRRIMSRTYGLLVKMLFRIRVSDTQLGMKFYRRKVLEDVLPRLIVKKFAFDIEILAVAKHLGYSKIYEAPVELRWDEANSTISKNVIGSIQDTLLDTIAVFYRLYILHYYDSSSKRKWRYDPELDFRVNIYE